MPLEKNQRGSVASALMVRLGSRIMQKIRLLAQLISTLVSHQVGDIIEVSDQDAQRLVTAGLGVPIEDTPAPAPNIPEPETTERTQRRRRETR
jgi:hypothetical protein